MGITSSPQQVTPALWSYTYVQAPVNGNGYDYFNVSVRRKNYGNVSTAWAVTVDEAAVHKAVLTGNTTVSFTGIGASVGGVMVWQVEIKGGSLFTVTWPESVKWDSSASAPALSANTTVLNFFTPDNGTTIYGGLAFADINA